MPNAQASPIPSCRLYKPAGLAVVRLNGKDFYLGPHGSETSLEEYGRLLAEWIAGGQGWSSGHAA